MLKAYNKMDIWRSNWLAAAASVLIEKMAFVVDIFQDATVEWAVANFQISNQVLD